MVKRRRPKVKKPGPIVRDGQEYVDFYKIETPVKMDFWARLYFLIFGDGLIMRHMIYFKVKPPTEKVVEGSMEMTGWDDKLNAFLDDPFGKKKKQQEPVRVERGMDQAPMEVVKGRGRQISSEYIKGHDPIPKPNSETKSETK